MDTIGGSNVEASFGVDLDAIRKAKSRGRAIVYAYRSKQAPATEGSVTANLHHVDVVPHCLIKLVPETEKIIKQSLQ